MNIKNIFKTNSNPTGVVIHDETGRLFDGQGNPVNVDASSAEKEAWFTRLAEGDARSKAHKMRDHGSAHLYA